MTIISCIYMLFVLLFYLFYLFYSFLFVCTKSIPLFYPSSTCRKVFLKNRCRLSKKKKWKKKKNLDCPTG